MVRAVLAMLMTVLALSATAAAADVPVDAETTYEDTLLKYDENDMPEVFFFPPEKARWNGYKITMREWYVLTDLQKERFVSEYLNELRGQYLSALDAVGVDYLEALNVFSSYSNDKAASEPPTKFIDVMLKAQKKI